MERAGMLDTGFSRYYFEDLVLGMEASLTHVVSTQDLDTFAALTGDRNPIHLDEDFASRSIFKGRIAHGMLTATFISAILGTQLPGPGAIYISQTLNFRAPVRIGDEVVATARIAELFPEKKRVLFSCDCSVTGKTVLEGDALLLVPSRAQTG
jgi:3-hydroxybutyryl-CoA dehydratase